MPDESRARFARDSINTPTPRNAGDGVATSPGEITAPGLTSAKPIDPNPHDHRAAATISPDARAELTKLNEEKRGRMNAFLKRNG